MGDVKMATAVQSDSEWLSGLRRGCQNIDFEKISEIQRTQDRPLKLAAFGRAKD
jgi:hypothetical protein